MGKRFLLKNNIWIYEDYDFDNKNKIHLDVENGIRISPLIYISFPSEKDPDWNQSHPGRLHSGYWLIPLSLDKAMGRAKMAKARRRIRSNENCYSKFNARKIIQCVASS